MDKSLRLHFIGGLRNVQLKQMAYGKQKMGLEELVEYLGAQYEECEQLAEIESRMRDMDFVERKRETPRRGWQQNTSRQYYQQTTMQSRGQPNYSNRQYVYNSGQHDNNVRYVNNDRPWGPTPRGNYNNNSFNNNNDRQLGNNVSSAQQTGNSPSVNYQQNWRRQQYWHNSRENNNINNNNNFRANNYNRDNHHNNSHNQSNNTNYGNNNGNNSNSNQRNINNRNYNNRNIFERGQNFGNFPNYQSKN